MQENVPAKYLSGIIKEITAKGTPLIKRAYSDWTSSKSLEWRKLLLNYAVTPIQPYGHVTGNNTCDASIIVDAMDILYSQKVDMFCIVSSYGDFARLATRLKESDKIVFGFGEKNASDSFKLACDRFILLENLIVEEAIAKTDIKGGKKVSGAIFKPIPLSQR
ncbi:MAG: NYN domain-containing protein [Bacteroidetes bacterium]|nr:NYN domain-containing protein [Bacteroidota bacterium]